MLSQVAICSIILSFATAIQSIVGFGLALFAVPLLLMAGLGLLPSVFLVLSVSCLSSLLGILRLKGDFDLRQCVGATGLRLLGVVPGYFLAVSTSQSSPATLKAALGFAIGLGVLGQCYKMSSLKIGARKSIPLSCEPSKSLAPWAFLSSGVFMGWLGMGGPPLVFWLLTGRQDSRKTRAFLFGVFALTIPFQLALMAYHAPETVESAAPILLVALPLCLWVSSVALKVGDRLEVENLQKLSLVMLTLLALKAFFDWFQTL